MNFLYEKVIFEDFSIGKGLFDDFFKRKILVKYIGIQNIQNKFSYRKISLIKTFLFEEVIVSDFSYTKMPFFIRSAYR